MSFLTPKPEGIVRILEMPNTRRGRSQPFMDWRIFGEQDQWAGL
jgi:hypothetical protein